MDEHGPLIKETILLEEPILCLNDSGRKSTHQKKTARQHYSKKPRMTHPSKRFSPEVVTKI